jgi:patatin-like phospholipase/acyl hydrolase
MEIVSCLSLSGGGVRGLFTAGVLAAFEDAAQARTAERFDLIAGTSIGGIIAIGLAVNIPAKTIQAAIAGNAKDIFRKRWYRSGLLVARYPQEPLRKVIRSLLGECADMTLRELESPLFVTAVDQTNGCSHLFRSGGLAGAEADGVSLLDAALATSAAPTFFPPHRIGPRVYVDGGLAANAPDLLAVSEAIAHLHAVARKVYVLSVGTAGSVMAGKPVWLGGGLPWILRHRIVELTLAAQEHASVLQALRILGRRYLRVERKPGEPIALDAVHQLEELGTLANEAVASLEQEPRWHEAAGRRARRVVSATR